MPKDNMCNKDCPHHPQTYFAPAERDEPAHVIDMSRLVENSPLFNAVLESVDGYIMILNEQRQVLAMNSKLMEDLKITEPSCSLGQRPGEVLRCVHAAEGPGGCGTSQFCSTCGAAIAIMASQKEGQPITEECLASVLNDGTVDSREFRVRSSPVAVGEYKFTVLVFQDISGDKRREALERTFFHDILNTVGGLMGWSSLLRDYADTDPKEAAGRIVALSKRLQLEIEDQRRLSQAEHGTLEVSIEPVPIREILGGLTATFEAHPAAQDKNLSVREVSPNEFIKTDAVLLSRVLTNMTKNALEAVKAGATVQVWFERCKGAPAFFVQNPGKIPDEVAMRIFQRSFSTKARSGRGIGTYSMKMFGERYLGGTVGFETSDEKGTIFSITLPAES
ncbi:MAG TPA: HAMP domain-containing sensor histidine kinase [Candidatus Sumerlaeota bacterium]|nr:HAMP domain-containing sensor histidine kinase [Candidatus Sumerlaeota bacterium]